MRKVLIAVGLLACLSLTACEGAVSEAEATAPPAKKKSLARPATMYAGQDQILSIQTGDAKVAWDGLALELKATGTAASAGWTDAALLPRIYAATPPDGIYEVDVIATQPATPSAQAPTPIEAAGDWTRAPVERVKGIRFMAKTNELVVMLPPKAAAPGATQ